ncbi:MAG: AMP-binding protein [Aliishimia sp.]
MFYTVFNTLIDRLTNDDVSVALVSGTTRLTYAQLGKRVAAIQYAMMKDHDLGLSSAPILVRGHKEFDVIAAMIACAGMGRGFVFAEENFPVALVQQIIDTCGCRLMLNVAANDLDVDIDVINTVPLLDRTLEMVDATAAQEDALFYVTFTSGSTGNPKGIPIQRANFASLLSWLEPLIVDSMQGGAYAAVNHASMAFDMSISDVWPTLLAGRAVFLLNHRNNANPNANISILLRHADVSAGTLMTTPAFLSIMMESNRFSEDLFPHLRAFWVGGENVPRPLLQKLHARFPKSTIYHAYGPSEVTCVTHCHPMSAVELFGDDLMDLGQAYGDTQVFVDDGEGQLRSCGEGEIVLVGPQVAGQYLPQSHPNNINFGYSDGIPSYHTGDLGILSDKNSMRVIGRIDRQVKLNGLRIELGAIEKCALDVPGISTAVAIMRSTPSKSLMLIVGGDELSAGLVEDLRDHLAKNLAPYMQPGRIEFSEDFPLTLSGKIDRRKMAESHA